ncbi:pyridoxamine 5'-phosphate oxidase family protein [Phyllobacterium sp. LjRoot231]|uniref:pyridoxamine 5'-phosphate oxidase family protein n=1 Tax=Phyllobacterium sp. LjRoot231 TaxID=3342289 RepID=UPI003ECD7672
MQITEMNQFEIMQVIENATVGRLACVHDGQPYIVPLNFAHHFGALYAFTTFGRKVEWMRSNPKVCVEFDNVSATNDWQSVIVMGQYEELTHDQDTNEARNEAYGLLSRRAEWWEPAFVKTVIRDHVRALQPVYFRILITEKTGHKAMK